MLSFKEWQELAIECFDLSKIKYVQDYYEGEMPMHGFIYPYYSHIYTWNNKYHVDIGNMQYEFDTLEQAEVCLYNEWYVIEHAE